MREKQWQLNKRACFDVSFVLDYRNSSKLKFRYLTERRSSIRTSPMTNELLLRRSRIARNLPQHFSSSLSCLLRKYHKAKLEECLIEKLCCRCCCYAWCVYLRLSGQARPTNFKVVCGKFIRFQASTLQKKKKYRQTIKICWPKSTRKLSLPFSSSGLQSLFVRNYPSLIALQLVAIFALTHQAKRDYEKLRFTDARLWKIVDCLSFLFVFHYRRS